MRQIRKRDAARDDLVEHFVYLADHSSLATADRFLANAEESFEKLLKRPDLGAPVRTVQLELAGIRKWPVKDFENWLIFYLPTDNGISVVRVLHTAQDWWGILAQDPR